MKKIQLVIILGLLLVLGACNSGNDSQEPTEQGVGFSLTEGSIEEAENIPPEERKQVLDSFDRYINTLNEKDIEQYVKTLSEENYDIAEERKVLSEQLDEYDIKRTVSNITIVKYNDKEAQVYADIVTNYKQLETGLETNPTGRQVTLFTKKGADWKVASVHYIGDNEQE